MLKYDLSLSKPMMNAAGTLGFFPERRSIPDFERLGAFVTNPISLNTRTPAHGTRLIPYPGGFLLHSGHPNPGLKTAMRRFAPRWARSPLPVIVHLLATEPDELAEMAQRLERLDGLIGVEVGLPPGATLETALAFSRAAAAGELGVLLRLPLELARELGGTAGEGLSSRLAEAGAAAVSLGPPRGALPGPAGRLVHGRLYGPGLFPQVLAAVQGLAGTGLSLIGGGGIYSQGEVEAVLAAGAFAVQLDVVLWRGGLVL
jgi:dihydroorotate dehydrogenase (NAD+) catalytic subunit